MAVHHCRLAASERRLAEWPVIAWGSYGGALKHSIAALKYKGQPQLGPLLGLWMGQAWQAAALPLVRPPVVVPIPLSQAKLKMRGFNQAALLAQGFCRWTGLRLYPQGLERLRDTEAQFRLSAAARASNLANAFGVGRLPAEASVLLLDDIYTSGATVRAAVAALAQRGIASVGVVVLARSGDTSVGSQRRTTDL